VRPIQSNRLVALLLATIALIVPGSSPARGGPSLRYPDERDSTQVEISVRAHASGAQDFDDERIRHPRTTAIDLEAFADGGPNGAARSTATGGVAFAPTGVSVDMLSSFVVEREFASGMGASFSRD
jgi:hypothetical protein